MDEKKVKQLLMKRRDELTLEDFDKHLRQINRLFGTSFKTDEFIPAQSDIFG